MEKKKKAEDGKKKAEEQKRAADEEQKKAEAQKKLEEAKKDDDADDDAEEAEEESSAESNEVKENGEREGTRLEFSFTSISGVTKDTKDTLTLQHVGGGQFKESQAKAIARKDRKML